LGPRTVVSRTSLSILVQLPELLLYQNLLCPFTLSLATILLRTLLLSLLPELLECSASSTVAIDDGRVVGLAISIFVEFLGSS
jgi:hypothetical protein